ncbi:hypothetical protein ACFL4Y_00175 [Gemmatimonadota bacterium]
MAQLYSLGEWLTTSVLGIVVLGTIGSLLALGLVTVVRWFIGTLLPRRFEAVRNAFGIREYKSGFIMGWLDFNKKGGPLVYTGYRLATVVVGSAGAVGFGLVALELALRTEFKLLSFVALVLTMAFGYSAARAMFLFWIDYRNLVTPAIRSAKTAAAEDRDGAHKHEADDDSEETVAGPLSEASDSGQ